MASLRGAETPARPGGRVARPPALSPRSRRVIRFVAPLGLVALIVLLVVALSGGGSGEPAPATGAAALVPSDALIYVHLSTDPRRPAVRRAQALLAHLPDHGAALTGLAQRLIAVVGGSSATNYQRDIRPWLGREAAFALLTTGGSTAGSVLVLDVRDRRRAAAFLARAGAHPAGRYRGQALYRYATGAELAFARGYLLVGQPATVQAAIDTAEGRTRALAENATYQRAVAGEPPGRVLEAYVSGAAVQRVLLPQSGFLGELGTLLNRPGLRATALSVSVAPPGLAVRVHSVLAGDRGRAAAATTFVPTLQRVLPAGSTLMLDVRNLAAAGPSILNATAQIGLLSAVPDLLHRLGLALSAQGVDVHGLLGLFAGETAVALAGGHGAPALVIVTRTRNEMAARITLASAVGPLEQVFAPPPGAPGLEPDVTAVPAGGVTASQLQLAPGLQLDFAVFHGLIVISTSVRGIADVAARAATLGREPEYRRVLPGQPARVTSLGFADFNQLLSLGEQTTLARSAGYRALLPDLERIRAVGLYATRGETDTTAELFLHIP